LDVWAGDSNISVDNIDTSVNPVTGMYNAHSTLPASLLFAIHTHGIDNRFLTRGVQGGLVTLDLVAHAAGLVDDHGTEEMYVALPGDWTHLGSSTGQMSFTMNTAGGWVFDYLVYNAPNTYFGAHNANYLNDGAHNIDLDMKLHGGTGTNTLGTVTLSDFDPDELDHQVTIEILQGSTVVESQNVILGAGGAYSFVTHRTGTYSVACKGSHWLRKLKTGVVLGSVANFALVNGDIDGDNEVAIGDYAILSTSFNSAPGDSSWNAEADLNGDDSVDIGDYAILSTNFGDVGD
jgi:hypothetical protein